MLSFNEKEQSLSALSIPARFSDDSRAVCRTAYDYAVRFRQNGVGVDHLVLALLDHHSTSARLREDGVNIDTLRKTVVSRNRGGDQPANVGTQLPRTSILDRIWNDAFREAGRSTEVMIEPEHLLRALQRVAVLS